MLLQIAVKAGLRHLPAWRPAPAKATRRGIAPQRRMAVCKGSCGRALRPGRRLRCRGPAEIIGIARSPEFVPAGCHLVAARAASYLAPRERLAAGVVFHADAEPRWAPYSMIQVGGELGRPACWLMRAPKEGLPQAGKFELGRLFWAAGLR